MADLNDLDDTPEAVEATARDLLGAGQTGAAHLLRRLLARAEAAEAERDELRERLAEEPLPPHASPRADAGGGEAPAGKSPDEIAQGKHLGP